MNDPSGFERPEGLTDLDTPPSQSAAEHSRGLSTSR